MSQNGLGLKQVSIEAAVAILTVFSGFPLSKEPFFCLFVFLMKIKFIVLPHY